MDKANWRIAFVYDAIYPYQKGGGERRFREIALQLVNAGYAVDMYGMRSWPGPPHKTLDGISLHGLCRRRPLYTSSGRRSITQALLFGLACLKLLWSRFDVIDCCGFPYFSLFACRAVATIRRKPLVSTWHEVWGEQYWKEYLGKLGWIGWRVERLAARMPDHIIAVSPTTAQRIHRELGVSKRISVVPNGFDGELIAKTLRASENIDAIFVGRLIAEKNVDLLVRAVARLTSRGEPFSCLIVGDGPERHHLEALAQQLDVTRHITFAGSLPRADDVVKYMKASRVLVLPSSREGFGMVALEAQACDVPVITTAHPANAAVDLIRDAWGGCVIEPNVDALTAALRALVAKERLPSQLASNVSDQTWGKMADARTFEKLYISLPGQTDGTVP